MVRRPSLSPLQQARIPGTPSLTLQQQLMHPKTLAGRTLGASKAPLQVLRPAVLMGDHVVIAGNGCQEQTCWVLRSKEVYLKKCLPIGSTHRCTCLIICLWQLVLAH